MPQDRPPKGIRKHLRDLASLAYERELNQALGALADDFDRWRRRDLSPWNLTDKIHVFHQGPARDLFVFYRDSGEPMAVGRAVARGLLEESEIPADVFPYIAASVEFYRACGKKAEETE